MGKDGKIVWWKTCLFVGSIISILYGLFLVGNLSLNTPTELRDREKNIQLQDMNFDCDTIQLRGNISSNYDFLLTKPIHVGMTISVSNNETAKITSILIPNTVKKIPLDSMLNLRSFYNKQSLDLTKIENTTVFEGTKDLSLNRSGSYSILLLEYDASNKLLCNALIHDQLSLINEDEELQINSEKEVIRNGIIMEALSWIVAGATGVTFLAQVGLKDE